MGNQCLTLISRAVGAIVRRPGDFAARMSREEFAVVLGTTAQWDALAIAERLRRSVEKLAHEQLELISGKAVTVSIGVSSITPHRHLDASGLLEKSKSALYRAKSHGRNFIST